ncbi:MAG: AAA family ATPase [Albidovulum sp.]|uniref:AAA family ATPase n=1 Tax=Albidovulum sp. TaxID=1872424 RepID=UPI001324FD7F|nr:AAA family ATPase [Defluviimonas sp.]KAB2883628.1 MAG: AAA family ATPase [Defluviimonas sp.]
MTDAAKSLLVIAPEPRVSEAIAASFASDAGVRVDRRTATLAGLNGHAIEALATYDVILFQTNPNDQADLAAIRELVAHRREQTKLIALADGDISLAQARALSDAGVDEVLPLPPEARTSTQGRAHAGGSRRAGRIIAVAQARGGIGSTTVAVNLADQLATGVGLRRSDPRPKVALVDLDLQFGTVGSFLDLAEQDTLLKLAMDGTVPDATFLEQSMATLPNGLSVLAAPARFAPLDALRAEQVAAILDTLRQTCDYVVVDLPRALVGWIEPVIERADEMLIVTDISVPSIRHCRRLIEFLTQDNLALPVEIVVNHQRKPLFRSKLQREAAKALDRRLDHWLPHDPSAAAVAADRGQPLSQSAPRSALGKAMRALARETRARLPAATQKSAK